MESLKVETMKIGIFKGLKDEIMEVKIGNAIIKIKPEVGDAEAFITLKKEMTEENAKKLTKIFVDVIARANPDKDREDVTTFVALHYGETMFAIAEAFGFADKEKIEEAKKKLAE